MYDRLRGEKFEWPVSDKILEIEKVGCLLRMKEKQEEILNQIRMSREPFFSHCIARIR